MKKDKDGYIDLTEGMEDLEDDCFGWLRNMFDYDEEVKEE